LDKTSVKNPRLKDQVPSPSVSPPWGLSDGNPIEVQKDGNVAKPTSPPWGRDFGKAQNMLSQTKNRKAPPNKDNFTSDLPPWGSSEE